MADRTLFGTDVHVAGRLTMNELNVPNGCIGNDAIPSGANLDPTKIGQQYVMNLTYPGTPAARTETVHVAKGAGELVFVDCGSITLCTVDAKITVDVLKNGVTALSAPVVLDSGNTARELESAGVLPPGTYVADDWFDVQVSVAAGAGALGTGLFVRLIFREDPH